jgi:hypothetical protein
MCGCAPSNGTISLLTRYRLVSVPSVIQRPCHLAWDGLRPVSGGVFQVVKTAHSRERTERTLLKALSQLPCPDKGREVWFSLGENHEKACRFGLPPLRKCLRVDSCSPQAPHAGRGNAADRRDPSLLMSHYRLRSPKSSRRQALILFRWLAADARVERAGARPSRAVMARRR